jgi:hypothetical protein
MPISYQETRDKFNEIREQLKSLSNTQQKKESFVFDTAFANITCVSLLVEQLQKDFEENQKQIEKPSVLTRLFYMNSLQQKQKEIVDAVVSIKTSIDTISA